MVETAHLRLSVDTTNFYSIFFIRFAFSSIRYFAGPAGPVDLIFEKRKRKRESKSKAKQSKARAKDRQTDRQTEREGGKKDIYIDCSGPSDVNEHL